MKIVIIGGGAGGAAAAARIRRLDESAEILMFERGEHVSYATCGMPYYAGGVIPARDDLFVQTPDSLRKLFALEVLIRHEVISINPSEKSVRVRDHAHGAEFTEHYDYLVLAPGAVPLRPPVTGLDSPAVMTVRTIPDIDRIRERCDGGNVRRAVIIGGGYIGLEMAENLAERGIPTVIIEAGDQVMQPLDKEMAWRLRRELVARGVVLVTGEAVDVLREDEEGVCSVYTTSGTHFPADLIILSAGVRPATRLAQQAGLRTGRQGIMVDSKMRTSDPAVFAVGDAVETSDPVTGRARALQLAGPAAQQARVAANTIVGLEDEYRGGYGTAVVKLFSLVAAMTGANERELKDAGAPYRKVYLHPYNHAGYYPGACAIAIKLLFSPDEGRVLGAQAIGREGVEKRIDVISVALSHKLTVKDLAGCDLCYAPPFGAAKDPVNLAGMAALNVVEGLVQVRHWDELTGDELLLDVRPAAAFRKGAVPGAVSIPAGKLRERVHELPKEREIAVYCHQGYNSYNACRMLFQKGYRACNCSGGYLTYLDYKGSGMVSVS